MIFMKLTLWHSVSDRKTYHFGKGFLRQITLIYETLIKIIKEGKLSEKKKP